jgi:hypothetical protein
MGLTGTLALLLVGVGVADGLSRSRSPDAAASSADGIEFGGGAAIASAATGGLAWFPIIPLASPFVCAAAAIVAGLVALREGTSPKAWTQGRILVSPVA